MFGNLGTKISGGQGATHNLQFNLSQSTQVSQSSSLNSQFFSESAQLKSAQLGLLTQNDQNAQQDSLKGPQLTKQQNNQNQTFPLQSDISIFSKPANQQSEIINDPSISQILQLIFKYRLHYDPYYTRIYGIVHDNNYLKQSNNNFQNAYVSLIYQVRQNDRLTRWYEKEIREFHNQYGIPCIINQRWLDFASNQSVLSIQCYLTLYHSDPVINMTHLKEQYLNQINEYRSLKQDQQEQQLLNEFLIKLEKRTKVDINSIMVLSLISNLNIMIHQDMIPSQDPKLISNGEEVFKADFPKYNILQLFTLDQKLFYVIQVRNEIEKMLLDEYIHYNVTIQHINYSEQANIVLQNTKHNESSYFQIKLVQNNSKKIQKLRHLLDQIEGSNKEAGLKQWEDAVEIQIIQNDQVKDKIEQDEKPIQPNDDEKQ